MMLKWKLIAFFHWDLSFRNVCKWWRSQSVYFCSVFPQSQVTSLFQSSSLVLCEQFCRLLNSVSSLSQGRSYLAQSQAMVAALCQLLTGVSWGGGEGRGGEMGGGVEGNIGRNALGAVQKLSLK